MFLKRWRWLLLGTALFAVSIVSWIWVRPRPLEITFDPFSWPEFRGPTGQGIARDGRLPLEWGPNKNIAWKQSIPGTGWSSPVIHAGRVYLTTSVPVEGTSNQSLRALCIDSGTGKLLWNIEVFLENGDHAPGIHQKNSHASPTPLLNAGRVYVHFGHQGTACLDMRGNILWRNSTIQYQPEHGNGGSPILVDGALIFSCDGHDQAFLIALDSASGKPLWRTDRKGPADRKYSFSTPLLISVNGQPQIISPGSGLVGAYEPATGREIWRSALQRLFGSSPPRVRPRAGFCLHRISDSDFDGYPPGWPRRRDRHTRGLEDSKGRSADVLTAAGRR